MAKTIAAHKLNAVERAVASYPDGTGVQGILDTLGDDTPRRTVQYWLNFLVKEGRVIKTGDRRWARYTLPVAHEEHIATSSESVALVEVSDAPGATQAATQSSDTPFLEPEATKEDAFRLRHSDSLRDLVRTIVRERHRKNDAFARITDWAWASIDEEDQDQFLEVAEAELLNLHEGNIASYRIELAELRAWQEVWRFE